MAGSYPDVPGRRMAYDVDGTIGLYWQSSGYSPTQKPGSYLTATNNESNDNEGTSYGWRSSYTHCYIFPELRDIFGAYAYIFRSVGDFVTSPNTTNGFDGTWTTLFSGYNVNTSERTEQFYRSDIHTASASAVRAIRTTSYAGGLTDPSATIESIHIYGAITSGSTPDRLLYIDNSTGLKYTGPIDWGNTPRGTTYDENWYIKNNSSTLTANNTNVDVEGLTGSSYTWHTFSTGGGFSTGLGPVSTIGPSSRWPASTPLTVRLAIPSTGGLGLQAARIVLDTSSWS